MKLSINCEDILQPLHYVNSVVERRQTVPILANVFLELDNDRLRLTGTDLEVEIVTLIENFSVQEQGECTVSAQKLLDICRSLPEDAQIELEVKKNKVFIRSQKSRFTLHALPSIEFPRLEAQTWQERFTITQSKLKQLIDNTAFSMGQQDVRFYLNGTLFEITKNKLVCVTTNGHRLSKSEIYINGSSNDEPLQAIVPRKAIIEINRLLQMIDEDVTIELNDHHIRFSLGNITFTSKLIDGKFPDYQTIIETDLPIKLFIDKNNFYQTLFRASILTNDKFRGIRISLEDHVLNVASNNPEQEESIDAMKLEGYNGQKMEFGFNVIYLLDILKVLDTEKVEFCIKDASSSCTLSKPNDKQTKYLVMPMRL